MLDVTRVLANSRPGQWRTLTIPLSCFAADADLASVVVPFAIETSGRFALTIAEATLAQKAPGPSPCPGRN
jgi:beta-glucosidase